MLSQLKFLDDGSVLETMTSGKVRSAVPADVSRTWRVALVLGFLAVGGLLHSMSAGALHFPDGTRRGPGNSSAVF